MNWWSLLVYSEFLCMSRLSRSYICYLPVGGCPKYHGMDSINKKAGLWQNIAFITSTFCYFKSLWTFWSFHIDQFRFILPSLKNVNNIAITPRPPNPIYPLYCGLCWRLHSIFNIQVFWWELLKVLITICDIHKFHQHFLCKLLILI